MPPSEQQSLSAKCTRMAILLEEARTYEEMIELVDAIDGAIDLLQQASAVVEAHEAHRSALGRVRYKQDL